MKKLLFFLLSFFLVYAPTSVRAAENFYSSFDVTYTIAETGITHVIYKIYLTNTSSQYYASDYLLELGYSHMENVLASDSLGSIDPIFKKSPKGYKIIVKFNKKVVGIGNTNMFTISFDTKDIAQKQEQVWEVNIPGVTSIESLSNYTAHVKAPLSFGKPTSVKPYTNSTSLDFTKEQLGKSGIAIIFGSNQTYAYKLTYHLKNSNLFPIKTVIALPPTTNYQDVSLSLLDPKPFNIIRDIQGNWLAEYYLKPLEKITITAQGIIQIGLIPIRETLPNDLTRIYTSEKPYWETTDQSIKSLAQKLKTPKAIYEYVKNTLTYDFTRVTDLKTRLGGVAVLQNPSSAVCLEFTDLFIAIARAAQIPAREVDGYANTRNSIQRPVSLIKDVLHAWPEYYDRQKKTWVMIDPTWGNTTGGVDYFNTLDFDHVAFVIRGDNSTYPVPAGGYKLTDTQHIKDVLITAIENTDINKKTTIELKAEIPFYIMGGFPIRGNITIKNTGQTMAKVQSVTVSTNTSSAQTKQVLFENIPPYGLVTKSVVFDNTSFLTNKEVIVTIQTDQETIKKTVTVAPFLVTQQVLVGGGVICAFIIAVSIIAAKTRRLPFFR